MRRPDSKLRIIVTGLIAQHLRLGGVAWDYGQYPLGLKNLGHDVYYFEDTGEWPYNPDGGATGHDWVAVDCKANVRHLADVMSRLGLQDRWAYRCSLTGEWHGLSDGRRKEVVESADLLINVSGTLEWPERYRSVSRLAYIDSDPVFTQLKILNGERKLVRRIDAHDVHFSFGERLSETGLSTGHRWRPTRQPIVLSEWHAEAPPGEAFTTVMSWTSYKPISRNGHVYGQKDGEFLRFIEIARKLHPLRFVIAMGGKHHEDWQADPDGAEARRHRSPYEMLIDWGWEVVEADRQCGDLDGYRTFIEASRGEWSVAKQGYVEGRTGWFSCRSACYLAAGRPVVVEDTGFSEILPVGEGLLAFQTLEEAIEGLKSVNASYARHAKSARAIAEAYFDARVVLPRLVQEALEDDV